MSYSFGMWFVPCGSFNRALNKAHKFCEVLGEEKNIRQIIENERYYFPSQRIFLDADTATDKEKHLAKEADRRALDGFFTLNFVYFHQAKLLALVGYKIPEADKFFKKHIGFQNSCDQDYERSGWKGIKLFENIFDECIKLNADNVLNSGYFEFYTIEEINEKLEYYQKTLAYDRIYDTLKLGKWLWGHNDKAFTRFSMNVLTSQELHYSAERYALRLFHNET